MGESRILDLFDRDSQRASGFSLEACGILFDYSKNPVSTDTRRLLLALAEDASVPDQIAAMFEGKRINVTEKRAVLHTALRNRSEKPVMVDGQDVMPSVRAVLERMRGMAERVRGRIAKGVTGKAFTDIVNIGIGGSDLGPLMVTTALRPYGSPGLRAHFVSNVDGAHLAATLAVLDPETTLFIISSKTFTTQETLTNANSAREWLLTRLAAAGPAEIISRPYRPTSRPPPRSASSPSGCSASGIGSEGAIRSGRRSACRSPSRLASNVSRNCSPAPSRWTSTSVALRWNTTCRPWRP